MAAPATGAVSPALPPGSPPPAAPGRYPLSGWGGASPAKAVDERPRDLRALRAVRLASVIGLVGAIAGAATASLSSFTSFLSVNQTSGGPSVGLQLPQLLGVVFGVTAALGLVEILLFRTGFRTLSEVAPEFSTPSTLALLAFVGLILAAIGFGLLLGALYQAIICVGSGNPLTASCLFTGTFWASVALLAVGAIIALVGYIGILIGIWRLGRRFDNSLFKVGAVLLIIPYLSLLGVVLVLVGTSQEIARG